MAQRLICIGDSRCSSARQLLFVVLYYLFMWHFAYAIYRSVYVVVVPLKKGRGPIRHIKSPDEMDLEEVNGSEFPCLSTAWFIIIFTCSKAKNYRSHFLLLVDWCKSIETRFGVTWWGIDSIHTSMLFLIRYKNNNKKQC